MHNNREVKHFDIPEIITETLPKFIGWVCIGVVATSLSMQHYRCKCDCNTHVDGDCLQCEHSIKLRNVVNATSVASAIYDGIE